VNRVLLAVLGVVLLAAGLTAVVGAFDLTRRWSWLSLPGGWPWTSPHDVLLPAADRQRWSGHGWFWPVAIAVLVVGALLTLWWLLAQLRTRGLRRMVPPGAGADGGGRDGRSDGERGGSGRVVVRGQALADAIADTAAAQPGVESAHARLAGSGSRPRVELYLTLHQDADAAAVLDLLDERVLADARGALRAPDLTALVRTRTGRDRAVARLDRPSPATRELR